MLWGIRPLLGVRQAHNNNNNNNNNNDNNNNNRDRDSFKSTSQHC